MLRRQPLYQQIKCVLRQRIDEGRWQSNEPLPSEWEFAAELGASQGTVRKALTALVEEGVLTRQQGRGTFVADVTGDWGDACMLTPGLCCESPEELAVEFLGCSRINASDDIAQGLQLHRGAPLIRVRQLWRLHGCGVALDDASLPVELFEGLDARCLRQFSGVYAVLQRRFGVRPRLVSEQTRAINLPKEEANLIGCSPGALALSILRVSARVDGTPVEWRQRYCLTDKRAYSSRR